MNLPIIRLDIVSDVVCPWCIIAYKSFEKAYENFKDKADLQVNWQPFELNPKLSAEGQNLREHLIEKYGITKEESVSARENITKLGKELGFIFNFKDETKIYNTFKAHELLDWSIIYGKSTELKLKLFEAYFTEGKNISDVQVLLDVAEAVGLDRAEAADILKREAHAPEVRGVQKEWRQKGISAVPAFIFNHNQVASGAMSQAQYESILEKLTSN